MRRVAGLLTVSVALVALVAMSAAGHETQIRVGMRGQRFTVTRVVAMAGDSVRFELESGGPHNIAFNADSIPSGTLDQLARNLGTAPQPLVMSAMLLDPGESLVLPLNGLAPGTYLFFCAPHYGGGMRGELVITARELPKSP
jgi:plastocyanin